MIGKEELQAVQRVMERGILSGYRGSWGEWFYGGEEIKALEKEWADYFHVKHAICCNSATSGLWLACAAVGLGLKKQYDIINTFVNPVISWLEKQTGGDYEIPVEEAIVTPYSMTCSASMPLHFGAKPVFADIEEDYFCLDPKSIEARITNQTKAIIVVDLFGQPYDADEINAIAKKHGIMVIEDAAQACGAKYKGKYAGTLGDIGVYSLNVHKHIQCGEGGIVVTDNDELAFKLRLLMNHAEAVVNDICRQNNYSNTIDFAFAGLNLRMTELSAAIAREQLKKLSSILKVYQENAKYFPIKVRPECTSAFYKYAFTEDNWIKENPHIKINAKGKKECQNELFVKHEDIFNFKRHYIDPIYKMPLFQTMGYEPGLCPVCEQVEENIALAWFKEVV
jgi:perosamine synthetase